MKISRFNIGCYDNFQQVFGKFKIFWFLPVQLFEEENIGLSFDVNSNFAYDFVESI